MSEQIVVPIPSEKYAPVAELKRKVDEAKQALQRAEMRHQDALMELYRELAPDKVQERNDDLYLMVEGMKPYKKLIANNGEYFLFFLDED